MRARARITAEADGRGGTRLTELHGESPLLLRRTGPRDGAGTTVHLVGGAAGPLRGDDLELTVTVGPGARLTVRSVAAQLALPGRAHLPPSLLRITANIAAGGTLHWLPEPMIAAAGCSHRTVTRVTAAAGAALHWRDDIVCGRHDEPSGTIKTETTITYASKTVYRHDLHLGPDAPGWSGAAVLGEARAYGTLISLPGIAVLPPTATFAVLPLALPASMATTGTAATALGRDIRSVKAALDPLTVAKDPVLVPQA